MKLLFNLIALFSGSFLFAQSWPDTTISKGTLDSLIDCIYNLKHSQQMQYYRFRQSTETFKIDTVHFNKDSTIIRRLTKDGNLLHRKIYIYDNSECLIFEKDEYFNRKGLLEFFEKWSKSCGEPKQNDPEIKYFTGMQKEMERFEYDSVGNILKRVWW